jgi:hypothetical protein
VLVNIVINILVVLYSVILVYIGLSKEVISRRQSIVLFFISASVLVGTPVISTLIKLELGLFGRYKYLLE